MNKPMTPSNNAGAGPKAKTKPPVTGKGASVSHRGTQGNGATTPKAKGVQGCG